MKAWTPGLYRSVTLPVRAGARQVPALVYVARSRTPGLPRPGYLEAVLAAARDWSLPARLRRRRWRAGCRPGCGRGAAPDAGEVA